MFYSSLCYAQIDTLQNGTLPNINIAKTRSLLYNKDAGLQYKNGDFTWSTWAFGERLFSGNKPASWRRVRQGMEIKFPAYNFLINGNKFRTVLMYEVDFTDNNFFKDSKRFKIWENLFLVSKMLMIQINLEYCLEKIQVFFQKKIIYHQVIFLLSIAA